MEYTKLPQLVPQPSLGLTVTPMTLHKRVERTLLPPLKIEQRKPKENNPSKSVSPIPKMQKPMSKSHSAITAHIPQLAKIRIPRHRTRRRNLKLRKPERVRAELKMFSCLQFAVRPVSGNSVTAKGSKKETMVLYDYFVRDWPCLWTVVTCMRNPPAQPDSSESYSTENESSLITSIDSTSSRTIRRYGRHAAIEMSNSHSIETDISRDEMHITDIVVFEKCHMKKKPPAIEAVEVHGSQSDSMEPHRLQRKNAFRVHGRYRPRGVVTDLPSVSQESAGGDAPPRKLSNEEPRRRLPSLPQCRAIALQTKGVEEQALCGPRAPVASTGLTDFHGVQLSLEIIYPLYRLLDIITDNICRMTYHISPKGTVSCINHNLESIPQRNIKFIKRAIEIDDIWVPRRDNNYPVFPLRLSSVQDCGELIVVYLPLQGTFKNFVIEMWKNTPFRIEEINILSLVRSIVNAGNVPVCQLPVRDKTTDFLLHVAQALFEEMVSLDQLIKSILKFAQNLVNADRASLFLVDNDNSELVSTVFDLKYDPKQEGEPSKKEIRIPMNKGIAGFVATTGKTMNIPDAYSDCRFNKKVDEVTGYRTTSILCMPIKVKGKVIAVVQMVNKRDKKAFKKKDESAFLVFSTFFGLALHHAKLYDKIRRKEQKYKVALEVLSYHNTCAEDEVKTILASRENEKEETINFNDFALSPFEVDDIEKCKGVLTMFDDLFDINKFDVTVLTRFILTVKKNYRKVPYHNFDHGWTVANTMYAILKRDVEGRFDYTARLALFVGCLCHDLDHRGYTNSYMSDIASPLAAMYSTSTLEHHHFNITVTILQQDGHNIFYRMASEEYRNMLDLIKHCILATDLAVFFPNLKKINELVLEENIDWNDESHRALCLNISMTCADLSAASKPFNVQSETVRLVYQEFYQQGHLERLAGKDPLPMMDPNKTDEQPGCQVQFLSSFCLPAFFILSCIFPLTKEMHDVACENLDHWKILAMNVEEDATKNKSV